MKENEPKRLRQWINKYASSILDDPSNGVIGVGLGKKSAGPLDDESKFCVTGFVEKKLSKKQLSAENVTSFLSSFENVSGASSEDQGIELDLIETGSRFATQPNLKVPVAQRGPYGGPAPNVDLQTLFENLRIGIGINNPEHSYPNYLSVGTLGFFVRDEEERLYLVSNNHVIAEENAANINDAIVQPGTLDLTNTELALMNTLQKLKNQIQIASLSEWIDIQYHSSTAIPFNEVDCAIAEVNTTRGLDDIARIGFGGNNRGRGPAYSVNANGEVNGDVRVHKAGRTTGWTEGVVSAINVVSDVQYGAGLARFRNQIAITSTNDNNGPFSKKGDSGSGILNSNHQLVGLLFAGSNTRTLANPIASVLTSLQNKLQRGNLTVVR